MTNYFIKEDKIMQIFCMRYPRPLQKNVDAKLNRAV